MNLFLSWLIFFVKKVSFPAKTAVIVMVYHVSNRFLKKALNLPLKFGYFHFHVSSSTVFTVSRLLIFVSAEPS